VDPGTGLGLTHPRGGTSPQQERTMAINSPTAPATAAPATRGRLLRSHAHPGLVLSLILTCQLMVVLDATIVNIALPDIRTALHFSPTSLSWVINAYTLTFGGPHGNPRRTIVRPALLQGLWIAAVPGLHTTITCRQGPEHRIRRLDPVPRWHAHA
jgi:hypothetical protein